MAIYVKQNGQWRQIDSPYVKKDGQWILPEEAYIKENGEWKLIFDRFAFVVETLDATKTQEATVLEGRLNTFGNTPNAINEAGHFRTTLTESLAAPAVAISQEARRIAVGGIDDSVYVYDLNFNFLEELIEPTEDISSLDIDDATGEIAASDLGGSTYVYDSDFNLIIQIGYPNGNPLSVSYNQGSGTTGKLAIGGEDNTVFIYDDTYTQINSVSYPATVRSVDWRSSDGWLAVGGDDPNVQIFDNSFSLDQAVNTNHQGTTKVAFGDANGQLGVLDDQKIHVYSNNFTRQDTLTQGGGGPTGDIAWDGSGRIAHGSQDDFVYVYDSSASLVNVFDEGQRDYQSIDWGPEQLLVAGTLEQQDGEAYVYSTAVSGFFEWGLDGQGTPNRVRSGPLQSEGVTYSFDLDGLNSNTVYDFRAGAEAEEGRTAFGDTLSFQTSELAVQTNPIQSGDIDPTSADVSGEVTTFNLNSGPPGSLPAVSIEYGETPPQGSGFPNEVDLGSSDSTFSAALTGLDTDTQYQYRAKAKFSGVTETGLTEIFTTDDLIINLDTLAAQNVSQRSADFQGEVTDIIGASSADTFFEFKETGASSFNRLPSSGFENVSDSNLPTTVTLNITGLTSDQDYEYRFVTDTGFDGGLETFTTPQFNITIDSASWDLRGSAFTGGESLTFGDSASVDATISEFDGQSYNYEVRESISGSVQGTVASGTNNTSTLNLSWNVGDSFTEGDATDSDTIEYELFVDTTIDGASSNDATTVSGNYVESPKIGVQQSVTINAQEGSFTDRDIDVSETSQLDTLSLNNISIDNDTSGNFSLQSATSETVSANTTEQITVRYSPPVGSSGTDTADLTFDHNAKNESSPLTVDLTGQVNVTTTAALASGQSGSIGFSDTFITNDSNTQTINITEDSGSGSYSINNVTLSGADSGDFNIVQNTVPSSVDDNGASFDVEFVPSSRGSKNATVEINHDADNPSGNLTVDVSGTAVEETTVTVEDESISVVEGNSDTVQVTIEETAGDFGATINSVSKSSAPDLGLWQVSSVPGQVNAGSTATFDVQFSPQDENDDQTLTLDIQYEGTDAGGTFTNTTQSTVDGTATLNVNVEINVTPNSLDFGTASSPETQSYTVTNTGNVDVDVSTTQPSSPFSIANGPGSGISPGNNTTITIEYNPTDTTDSSDSITVTGNGTFDPGSDSENVSMSGDGIPENPEISISPPTFDYGTGSGSTTFDVTNVGNVGLSGVSVTTGGTDSGEFIVSSGLGTNTLSTGQTKQVTVDYNPSTTDPDSGSVDVNTNEGASASATVSGDGQSPFTDLVLDSALTINDTNAGTQASGTMSVTNNGNSSASPSLSATATSGGSNVSNVDINGPNSIGSGNTEQYTVSADVNGDAPDGASVTLEGTVGSVSSSDTFTTNNYDLSLSSFSLPGPITGSGVSSTQTELVNNGSLSYDTSNANVQANTNQAATAEIQFFDSNLVLGSGASESFTVLSNPDENALSDGDQVTVTVSVTDNGPRNQFVSDESSTYTFNTDPDPVIDNFNLGQCNAGENTSATNTVTNNGSGTINVTGASATIGGSNQAQGNLTASNPSGNDVEVTYEAINDENDGDTVDGTVTISFDSQPSLAADVSGTTAAPELVVQSGDELSLSPSNPNEGETVSGSFTVTNQGSIEADSYNTLESVSGSQVDLTNSESIDSVSSIPPNGGSVTINMSLDVNANINNADFGTTLDFTGGVDAFINNDVVEDINQTDSFTITATTPSVETSGATVSSGTLGPEATISGIVADFGGNANLDVAFEYKEESATSFTTTSSQTINSPNANFNETIDGLLDNATYEYRAIITSTLPNTDDGSLLTFTTGSGTDGGTDGGSDGGDPIAQSIEPGIEPLDDDSNEEGSNDDNQNQ